MPSCTQTTSSHESLLSGIGTHLKVFLTTIILTFPNLGLTITYRSYPYKRCFLLFSFRFTTLTTFFSSPPSWSVSGALYRLNISKVCNSYKNVLYTRAHSAILLAIINGFFIYYFTEYEFIYGYL